MSAKRGRRKKVDVPISPIGVLLEDTMPMLIYEIKRLTLSIQTKYTHNRNTLKHHLVVELIHQIDFEGITLQSHHFSIISCWKHRS